MLWHLYVPNLPLDPAVGLRAHSNYLQRQFDSLTQLYALFEQSEALQSGNSSNIKLAGIANELATLRQGLDSSGVLPVEREGDAALLAGLFRELRSFRDQIINDIQIDSLLTQLRLPWSPEVANRESNLQYSIENLLRRLSSAYAPLDDILGPVRLSLCSLKIGLSLLLHSSRCASLDTASSPFASLLLDLTSFPAIAHTNSIQSAELPLSLKVGESPLAPARATLLQTSSLVSQLSTHAVFDRIALRRLTHLYDRMHYLWTADRRHEDQAAEAAASLYKAKTDIQQIATDEEIEAAEFAKLFPSFEESADDVAPNSKPATIAPSLPRLIHPSDQAALAKLHVHLFARDETSAVDFESLRNLSIGSLLPGLFESMAEGIDSASAVYRIKTLVEISQGASPTTGVEAYQRDFYNEPDVRETAKAVPILQGLSLRLTNLIDQFPEQMVLHNLRERCEAILALSSKSSVAQVLTAIEALLVHSEDWETYASREHSLVINRTAITGLIVEWRRLELTCWSRLLSTVQDHFGDPVAEWWFRFYETTIRSAPGVDADSEGEDGINPQTLTEYYRELVALLDSFLATSSLGQFGSRLQLVLSFARLAARLGEDSKSFEVLFLFFRSRRKGI
jgi:midasin